MENQIKMKLLLFIFFLNLPISFFSQKRTDSLDCYQMNLNSLINDFLEEPSCEKYKEIKIIYTCRRKSYDDLMIPYVAALQKNCKQAYQDLYQFYYLLNKELSNEKNRDCDTLLLNNLDKSTRDFAIKALLKADIDKLTISTFYYFGIYVKKDRKKAIALYKSDYQYKVSDKKIIEELESMKDMVTPCQ